MPAFYDIENETFAAQRQISLLPASAAFIAKKLARHFKFFVRRIIVRKLKRYLGMADLKRCTVTIPPKTNLLVLVHELAHLWQAQLTGRTRHSRKLLVYMRRMFRYCEKMKYWRN
jgi:hypothetical protein